MIISIYITGSLSNLIVHNMQKIKNKYFVYQYNTNKKVTFVWNPSGCWGDDDGDGTGWLLFIDLDPEKKL